MTFSDGLHAPACLFVERCVLLQGVGVRHLPAGEHPRPACALCAVSPPGLILACPHRARRLYMPCVDFVVLRFALRLVAHLVGIAGGVTGGCLACSLVYHS